MSDLKGVKFTRSEILPAVLMKIQAFWDRALCWLTKSCRGFGESVLLNPVYEDKTFFRNVSTYQLTIRTMLQDFNLWLTAK